MTSHNRGLAFLVTASALWSMGGLFIKLVPWPPLAVAAGRSAIAALVILIFLSWKNLKFKKSDIVTAVFYALTVSLFVSATKLTTAANAIFLQYTAPIYVIVLAHFYLKERATLKDLVTVLLVVAGMGLFFFEKMSLEGFWGNVLAIASGITFAMLTVLLRRNKESNALKPIFLGNLFTALVLSPAIFFAPPLDFYGFGYLLILGVFQLGLAYVCYAKAVPHVQALETVLVAMLEPILNPIWVLLTLDEAPSLLSLIGGAVILLAVTFRSVKVTSRRKKSHRSIL